MTRSRARLARKTEVPPVAEDRPEVDAPVKAEKSDEDVHNAEPDLSEQDEEGQVLDDAPGEAAASAAEAKEEPEVSPKKQLPPDLDMALEQVAFWIANADAVLVCSGAGMGADAGLATFRGQGAAVAGWPGLGVAWPASSSEPLTYQDICKPHWFVEEPDLVWAFWGFCHRAYKQASPHPGYDLIRRWSSRAPLGCFGFTSNVDSHWVRSGWDEDRLVEVHGALRWLQCTVPCKPEAWPAPADFGFTEDVASLRARGELPKCIWCGAIARPVVKMFGDDVGFSQVHLNEQVERYDRWLQGLESRAHKEFINIVCLEIGCGKVVPTVRNHLELVDARFPSARFVRINPEDSEFPAGMQDRAVSLPLGGLAALELVEEKLSGRAGRLCRFLVRDHDAGAAEVDAPCYATSLHVLHRLEHAGVDVKYGPLHDPRDPPNEPYAIFYSTWEQPEFNSLAAPTPQRFLFDCGPAPVDQRLTMACFQVAHIRFGTGISKAVQEGIDWCKGILREMLSQVDSPEYQQEIREQKDRRGVAALVRRLQEAVLPTYGLPADEQGLRDLQSKIWAYGCCDQEIFKLAEEAMRLSHLRLSGHLPWIARSAKDRTANQQRSQKAQQRLLARRLDAGEKRRRALVRKHEALQRRLGLACDEILPGILRSGARRSPDGADGEPREDGAEGGSRPQEDDVEVLPDSAPAVASAVAAAAPHPGRRRGPALGPALRKRESEESQRGRLGRPAPAEAHEAAEEAAEAEEEGGEEAGREGGASASGSGSERQRTARAPAAAGAVSVASSLSPASPAQAPARRPRGAVEVPEVASAPAAIRDDGRSAASAAPACGAVSASSVPKVAARRLGISTLSKGVRVRMSGLAGAASRMNGSVGTLVDFDRSQDKWRVQVDGLRSAKYVKAANLSPVTTFGGL